MKQMLEFLKNWQVLIAFDCWKNSVTKVAYQRLNIVKTSKAVPHILEEFCCHDPLPVVGVNGVLHLDVEEVAVTASTIKLNSLKLI